MWVPGEMTLIQKTKLPAERVPVATWLFPSIRATFPPTEELFIRTVILRLEPVAGASSEKFSRVLVGVIVVVEGF